MGPGILLPKIGTAGAVLGFLEMQLKTSRVLNDRQYNPLQQNAWPRLKDLMWQPWWHTHSSLRRLGRKWSSDLKYVFLNIFPLSHLAFCLTMSNGKNALTTAVTDVVRGSFIRLALQVCKQRNTGSNYSGRNSPLGPYSALWSLASVHPWAPKHASADTHTKHTHQTSVFKTTG